ncbi:MAG TPA: DUF2784 domain-containing protein [Gallionellaceae bacterium]|nr:DUF2784 domain-containing protein [Gallionellaceae bacterium]
MMPDSPTLLVLADAVLVLHAAVVAFVVAGLAAILIGNFKGWHWVNQPYFRIIHLLAIALVLAEAWLGIPCPLTTLEMWLRRLAGADTYSGGFIAHWLHRLIFYDLPPWVFVLAYSLFAALVLAAWIFWPPHLQRKASRHD